jgi:4,5-DOPA dioxygenase extradiol
MTSIRTPAIFFGHGNPMNAIQTNEYTRGWNRIGEVMQKPKAIVCVSAHWYVPDTAVTISTSPRTIHDFGGFPEELFRVQYPAPGDPDLAQRIQKLLAPTPVTFDERWGLDHGTWSVLRHVYPKADVPVIQLSIDETQPPAFHYEIGRRLAPLRDEGVLLVGSGNLVHNLHAYAWGRHIIEPFEWATRFEQRAREAMSNGDDKLIVDYEAFGRDAVLSVPTPDHYLPLLYILGARNSGEEVTYPVEGVDGGSISMLAVKIG